MAKVAILILFNLKCIDIGSQTYPSTLKPQRYHLGDSPICENVASVYEAIEHFSRLLNKV